MIFLAKKTILGGISVYNTGINFILSNFKLSSMLKRVK